MTLAIDSLGIPFVLGCVVVWMAVVVILARVCALNDRLSKNQRASRLELDGSWEDFLADCEARANRARFRSVTRHGRDAA